MGEQVPQYLLITNWPSLGEIIKEKDGHMKFLTRKIFSKEHSTKQFQAVACEEWLTLAKYMWETLLKSIYILDIHSVG